MNQKLIIEGQLMGLNEFISANKSNRYKGGEAKKEQQRVIWAYIKKCKLKPIKNYPVIPKIVWYEPDKKRDYDNVVFAKKFIFDALVECKILKNDARKYISGVEEKVLVDKNNPRIEVEFLEKSQSIFL